jgi:TDG/mug DNA glycosylase family protein
VGEPVRLRLPRLPAGRATDLAVGAGFTPPAVAGRGALEVVRARSLPDTVGPGLRLLVCGLNPSLFAADAGVGFARPGNRFWPAALAAGIVPADRDPDAALAAGVGMTDLAKRATARADELAVAEYVEGLGRVERLVAWLAPAVVLFVGLDGWRKARDRRAVPGWQPGGLGGRPLYAMPSTSGLNARTPLGALVAHVAAAAAGPGDTGDDGV